MHALRVKLGAKPVHVAEYAKKWKSFYKVLRKNIALNAVSCAIENGFEAVTCGHTHYPEDMVVDGIRYINTGAWTELPAHYLYVTADEMVLKELNPAFVSHRLVSAPSNQMDSGIHFMDATHRPAAADQDNRDIRP
jgi:UDP-2,3-diacylglucosamine pyrophosphatase LpxH